MLVVIVFSSFPGSNRKFKLLRQLVPAAQSEPASSGPDAFLLSVRACKLQLSKISPETSGSRSPRRVWPEPTPRRKGRWSWIGVRSCIFRRKTGRSGVTQVVRRREDERGEGASMTSATRVSLLAAQGVLDKTIAEIVGHSDVRLTKNVYTRATQGSRGGSRKSGKFSAGSPNESGTIGPDA